VRGTSIECSDFFSLFGFPKHPSINLSTLESRYYELTRQFHPDFYQKKSKEEQEASLRSTALITTAYRTLKDPVERGRYWLELQGVQLSHDNSQVPQDFAEEAFEVFDALRRWKTLSSQDRAHLLDSLHNTREGLEERMKEDIKRLEDNFSRWPASGIPAGPVGDAPLLTELREILSRISYLSSLAQNIEKTLQI